MIKCITDIKVGDEVMFGESYVKLDVVFVSSLGLLMRSGKDENYLSFSDALKREIQFYKEPSQEYAVRMMCDRFWLDYEGFLRLYAEIEPYRDFILEQAFLKEQEELQKGAGE